MNTCGAPMTDSASTLHCDLPVGHADEWHGADVLGGRRRRRWQINVCHRCYRQGALYFETVYINQQRRARCTQTGPCDERARIGRLGFNRSNARVRG